MDKNNIKKRGSMAGVMFITTLIIYLGLSFVTKQWHLTWLLWFLPIIIDSAIDTVKSENLLKLNIPVICTAVYLSIGMFMSVWHPTWVLFLLIPLYYSILGMIKSNKKQ